MYSFEKLEVFQEARELAVHVYHLTQQFPGAEKFGLANQMRRAIVSVCSNLAEGSSRHSFKDKSRFTEIAYGSMLELLAQCLICSDLLYISTTDLDNVRQKADSICYKLNNLRSYQIKQSQSP